MLLQSFLRHQTLLQMIQVVDRSSSLVKRYSSRRCFLCLHTDPLVLEIHLFSNGIPKHLHLETLDDGDLSVHLEFASCHLLENGDWKFAHGLDAFELLQF